MKSSVFQNRPEFWQTNNSDFPLTDELFILHELPIEPHNRLVPNGPELLAHLADEELVMRHDDDSSLKRVQRLGQCVNGLYPLSQSPQRPPISR